MSPRSVKAPPESVAAPAAQRRPVLGLVPRQQAGAPAAPATQPVHRALLVVGSRSLVAQGVAHLVDALQGRWESPVEVLHAPDGKAALEILTRRPDALLALLDLPADGGEGDGLLGLLRQACPALPLVVLSADCSPAKVLALLRAGVRGVLPLNHTPQLLSGVLELVLHCGGSYLPAEAFLGDARQPWASAPTPPTHPAQLGLTARQSQVLQLLAQGNANKRICQRLGVSPATVKSHLSAVMRALKVDNRTQAAVAASRLGLVFDAPPAATSQSD